MTESAPVYIVGGGWTGLSAAIELCRKKIPVTLIESGKQLGGKTRRVSFDGKPVDQSQIMLFGGYQNILRLFRTLKIQENQDYERVPFDLILRRKRKTKFRFRHFRLPAPYGIRAAMYLARGMPMQDKIRSLRLIDKIRRQQINLTEDISVAEFLMQQGQRDRVTRFFWRPLCRMFLHADVSHASAALFMEMVTWLFLADPDNSEVLLLHQDLSTTFSDRAMDYIEQKGGTIKLGHEVTALNISKKAVSGIQTDDAAFTASRVILAAAREATQRLLEPHRDLLNTTQCLQHLDYANFVTVYLQFPRETTLPTYFLHTLGTLGHCLIDKRMQHNPGMMAVTILEKPQVPLPEDEKIVEEICAQLSILFPHWKSSLSWQVVRAPEAVLSCTVDTGKALAAPSDGISGLWVAGDFVRAPMLPSLESAVYNGRNCARRIIEELSGQTGI